jgi:hypothetical protein
MVIRGPSESKRARQSPHYRTYGIAREFSVLSPNERSEGGELELWSRQMRSAAIALVLLVSGCSRGEPPAPAGIDASVAPLPAPVPDASTVVIAVEAGAIDASAKTEVDAGDTGALPQNKDRPKAEGPAFTARSTALWEAIVKDDPDLAMPFFFPITAYLQVKDVGSPASDWKHRLVGAFKRDIHALHARLGDKADTAKLVRFDVPDDRAKWIEPGEEYNKLGYWRVYGTRIVYTSGEGTRERSFEVSSLISWRGEWFVVHLTGFK